MNKEATITLKNDVKDLGRLAEFFEQLGESWFLAPDIIMAVNLSLEEAVSNIIFYAWPDSKEHLIDLKIKYYEKALTIILSDDGKPFDPTKREEPDINLPIEERPIGGLGIHLIKRLMDGITYARKGNRNQLTLIKNIK